MKRFVKYKSFFSGIILSAYFTFFILDTFHYHHIDYLPQNQVNTEASNSPVTTDLSQINLNIICHFQTVFSSIQTVDNLSGFRFSLNNNYKELQFSDFILSPLFNKDYKNNPLRAPPSHS